MAEPKRLQFTTVSPPNTEEKKKTPQICHRFTLSLSASTDTTCPEFSYTDLVKSKLVSQFNLIIFIKYDIFSISVNYIKNFNV